MSGSGLGLSGFLGHNPNKEKLGGGGRDFVPGDWKEKGEYVFWLHLHAEIVPAFVHQFIEEREGEDRETKKMRRYLSFPRFNSPDPERVHANQYYRDRDSGVLKILLLDEDDPKYTRSFADPFLLLREWLRWEGDRQKIALDQVVFEWQDSKKRELIQWQLGALSGLEKRGDSNWSASIDTKNQYIFAVVPDDKPESVLLLRETQLVGDAIRDVIKKEIEGSGDEAGDPMVNPYAFKLKYHAAEKSPMKKYSALRFDKAKYRDEIFQLINSESYPDPREQAKFHRDDLIKIRAAFEAAAQIDLPLDIIFSPDPEIRRTLLVGTYDQGARPAAKTTQAAPQRQQERSQVRPPATPGAPKQGRTTAPPVEEAAPATGGRRRKAIAPQDPKPAPVVETIPCDACGAPMDPKDTKCGACGQEYEVDGDTAPTPPPKTAAPKVAPKGRANPPGPEVAEMNGADIETNAAAHAAVEKTKPKGGRSRGAVAPPAETKTREPGEEDEPDPADAHLTGTLAKKCWACGSPKIGKNDAGSQVCLNCGVDIGDDLAFG